MKGGLSLFDPVTMRLLLVDIVESVSHGRTRALAHLSARERETLIARMRGFAS